jgi:hypothetical protein
LKNKQKIAAVIILSSAFGFLMASSTPYGYSAYADKSETGTNQELICNNFNSGGTGGAAATGNGGDIYNICIMQELA